MECTQNGGETRVLCNKNINAVVFKTSPTCPTHTPHTFIPHSLHFALPRSTNRSISPSIMIRAPSSMNEQIHPPGTSTGDGSRSPNHTTLATRYDNLSSSYS